MDPAPQTSATERALLCDEVNIAKVSTARSSTAREQPRRGSCCSGLGGGAEDLSWASSATRWSSRRTLDPKLRMSRACLSSCSESRTGANSGLSFQSCSETRLASLGSIEYGLWLATHWTSFFLSRLSRGLRLVGGICARLYSKRERTLATHVEKKPQAFLLLSS